MVAGAFLLQILRGLGLSPPSGRSERCPSLEPAGVLLWVLTVKIFMGLAICVLPMMCAASMALLMAAGVRCPGAHRDGLWPGSFFGAGACLDRGLFVRQADGGSRRTVEWLWSRAGYLRRCWQKTTGWKCVAEALVNATVPFDILGRWISRSGSVCLH